MKAPAEQNLDTHVIPDVWTMPSTGMQWCDCGENHDLDKEFVEDELFDVLGGNPDWVTHKELCHVIQTIWNYESVCAFFFDHVARSATAVHGSVEKKYRFDVAVDIAGYFTKTWQGCPEEACEGGMDWSDQE